jgi:DNA-binding MarR family transcriptional regulator
MPDSIKFQVDYWLGIKRNIDSSVREVEFDLQLIKMKSNSSITDMVWNQTDPFYSLRNLLDEFLQNTDVTGVFFHIDNLELVKNDILIDLLNNSRDTLFNLKNTYWFLCSSDENLPNEIYVKSPRFSSIITGHSLNLQKLNSSDVIKAIESRIEISKINSQSIIPLPFTEDVIRNIYSFTNFDLRESFKIFQYLASDFYSYDETSKAFLEGKLQLDFFIVKDALIEYCLKYTEYISLTRKECELLDYIFLNSPCSIQAIRQQNIFSSSTINERLKKMIRLGLIKFDTKSINSLTFRLKTVALSLRLSKKANNIASDEILLID